MQHIIITGNPVDGFQFYGPFESPSDATGAAEANFPNEWWIGELTQIGERAIRLVYQCRPIAPEQEPEAGTVEGEWEWDDEDATGKRAFRPIGGKPLIYLFLDEIVSEEEL